MFFLTYIILLFKRPKLVPGAQHVTTLHGCDSGVDRLLEAFQQKYPDSPVLPDVLLGNKKAC